MSRINIKIAASDKITAASLNQTDVETFALLASALSNKPERKPPSADEIGKRTIEREDAVNQARHFHERLLLLSSLSPGEVAAVFALVSILKMPDPLAAESNWLQEIIKRTLYEVSVYGPESVLAGGPSGMLCRLAFTYDNFLDEVDRSRQILSIGNQEAK